VRVVGRSRSSTACRTAALELPYDAIEQLGWEINVRAPEITGYDFQGGQIKNHRREIRDDTGSPSASVTLQIRSNARPRRRSPARPLTSRRFPCRD
jgi:hypothetical protein